MTNGQLALGRVIEALREISRTNESSDELAAALWDDFRLAVRFAVNQSRDEEARAWIIGRRSARELPPVGPKSPR
jgi:hypothetical protein